MPPEADAIDGFRVTLHRENVDRVGSKRVTSGVRELKVHGELTSRTLGHVVVGVDASQCQQLELRTLQLRPQAEALRDRFLAGSITGRGQVSIETSNDGIEFTIPLKIAIPNFFDAEANVVLSIALTARSGRAVISLLDVDVDITFSLTEHLLSLGSATAAQSLLQPLAADLIRAFLGAQLEGDLSGEVNALIGQILKLWQNADSRKRKFKLYSIETTSVGLTITGCPL